MKIVFFGTPIFSAQILDFLMASGQFIIAVVTRPDKPRGRFQKLLPSAVKSIVQEKWPEIPILQPEKASTEEFAQTLKIFQPEVFVVVAYGEIIKENILSIPTKICVNVHTSLLPKYRGAAPIQRALLNGEKETGVTIIEMVLQMDAGPILNMAKLKVDEEMIFGELEGKLCELAKPTLLKVLTDIGSNSLKKATQDQSQVTFAAKISLEDRVIDWNKNMQEVHNQVRALSPLPGAFCYVETAGQTKILGIKKTKKIPELKGAPGETLSFTKKEWIVACGLGAVSLIEIQLEGKKNMPIEEFMRGNPCLSIKF